MLSGDFGHNSETAILIEQFITEYKGALTLVGDSLDALLTNPEIFLNRAQTVAVCSLGNLQKYLQKVHSTVAITSTMDLWQLMEALSDISQQYPAGLVTFHQGNYIVALKGQVSYTSSDKTLSDWPTIIGAYLSVWWLQNPGKAFEAISTAIYEAVLGDPSQ